MILDVPSSLVFCDSTTDISEGADYTKPPEAKNGFFQLTDEAPTLFPKSKCVYIMSYPCFWGCRQVSFLSNQED